MKKSARYSLSGIALSAIALCLALPAQAQYMDFRTDKPGIELDLDVLNDLPPRTTKKDTPPATTPPDRMDAPPAAPVPVVEPAPRKMHKPLFAAPIPTPMPQQVRPAPAPRPVAVPAPAARKPYNPYLTAPVPTPPPRPAYAPAPVIPQVLPRNVIDNLPTAAQFTDDDLIPPPLPRKKPDALVEVGTQTAPAPLHATPKAVLSYPPATSRKAPVQHFARPVLPDTTLQALPDEIISEAEIAKAPVTLPAQKPGTETKAQESIADATPVRAAPPRPLRKPLDVIMQQEPAAKEDTSIEMAGLTDQETVAIPVAPPARVFTRPALVTTDAPPPTRPALKKAEVTMPLSENDFEKIAVNMERVPVQVAIAPPKPLHPAGAAPLAADMTLEFDRISENLNDTAQAKLKNIVAHMSADENKRLQIRAYATGEDGSTSSARSKSLTRATEIRSFLMDNGIRPTRVIVRALGQETDRKPLDRVDLIFMP